MPYAPERFQLEIPTLSPWLAEERPDTKYLGPNINWANVPENILALLNLADPSGMMSMAPVGFMSSPKGLSLGKKIKPIQEAVSKVKKLSPAQILRNKEIDDVIRSEVHKVIRAGNKGPSRTGGGLMDFLKDERGLVGKDINKPIKLTEKEITHFDKLEITSSDQVWRDQGPLGQLYVFSKKLGPRPVPDEYLEHLGYDVSKIPIMRGMEVKKAPTILDLLKDERGSWSNKPISPTRQAHIDAVKDMAKAGVKNPNVTLKPAAPEDAKVVASELAKRGETSTEPTSLLQFLKDKLTGPEGERGSISNKPLKNANRPFSVVEKYGEDVGKTLWVTSDEKQAVKLASQDPTHRDIIRDDKWWSWQEEKPLTRADIFREAPKPGTEKSILGNVLTGNANKPSYPAKSAKEMLGNDLVAEIAEKGYSPQIRAKILARYATTPERQQLVSKVAPRIEKLLEADPTIAKGRGYMYGSFVSEKPNPSDIDLLIRSTAPDKLGLGLAQSRLAAQQSQEVANEAYKGANLHTMLVDSLGSYISPASGKRIPSWAMTLRSGLQKRYPGADLVRLWGGLPVGAGLGDYIAQNTTPEQKALDDKIEQEKNGGYDLAGYIQKYGIPTGYLAGTGEHLTDEFKLPNHITFSQDSIYSNDKTPGGIWAQDADKVWHYRPSDYVLSVHPIKELEKYFKEYAPDSVLDLPQTTK